MSQRPTQAPSVELGPGMPRSALSRMDHKSSEGLSHLGKRISKSQISQAFVVWCLMNPASLVEPSARMPEGIAMESIHSVWISRTTMNNVVQSRSPTQIC